MPVRVGLGDGSQCLVKSRGAQPAPGPAERNSALDWCDAAARWDRLPPAQPPSEPGCQGPPSPAPTHPGALAPAQAVPFAGLHRLPLTCSWGSGTCGCLPDSTDACGCLSRLAFLSGSSLSLPATSRGPNSVPSTGLGWQTVMLNKCWLVSPSNLKTTPITRSALSSDFAQIFVTRPWERHPHPRPEGKRWGHSRGLHQRTSAKDSLPGHRGAKKERLTRSLAPCSFCEEQQPRGMSGARGGP